MKQARVLESNDEERPGRRQPAFRYTAKPNRNEIIYGSKQLLLKFLCDLLSPLLYYVLSTIGNNQHSKQPTSL